MRLFAFVALGLFATGCNASFEGGAFASAPASTGAPPLQLLGETQFEELPKLEASGARALELTPTAELSLFERAVSAGMRALGPSTVLVEMVGREGVVGHGSGAFVSAAGDVLTAAHVVSGKDLRFRVVLADGRVRDASVVRVDAAHDIALLRAPGEPVPFLRLHEDAPSPGDWVVCAGYGGDVAQDRAPMHSAGVVVDARHEWTVVEYDHRAHFPVVKSESHHEGMLKTDCASVPGMSGGPVVDLDGRLMGVVVGSDGTASPISALRSYLSASRYQDDAKPSASPAAVKSPLGSPSRALTVAPAFARTGEASSLALLELELEQGGAGGAMHFPAVLLDESGLAVAPAIRIQSESEPKLNVPASSLKVVGVPDASCEEIVAVRGEVALLRLKGLDLAKARPIGPGARPMLGEMIEVFESSGGAPSYGFVTGEDRSPGPTAPDGPRWGCGLIHNHFRREHPSVDVAHAIAHDAGSPRYGSLLLDRFGAPVAFEVATRGQGLSYALPWPDVLQRFGLLGERAVDATR